ncbi:MAG TPA: hypothetical protein VHS78_09560 [Candidatus Elarobacter sp.]|jgi:hypothetical protein|nr:hypothetical protein [Candidatus Elarobacter sp.]
MRLFAPFAAVVSLVLLALTAESPLPFAWPTPLPTGAPAPQPTVLWNGAPAASFALELSPLGVTPDGEARALVRVILRDAQGNVTKLRRGADFDYFTDRGEAQWQTRLRYGGPAAIVAVRDDGPVNLRVVANRPAGLGEQHASFDTRAWRTPRVVATAVGPHLVRIGWFPRVRDGTVRIDYVDARARPRHTAVLRAPASSWDDTYVLPNRVARYTVRLPGRGLTSVHADVPPELPPSTVNAIRGKSAWLAFSGDPLDDESYAKLDPDRIVATAVKAGLRSVELRLAYGAFDELTPDAKTTVDRVIDGLAAHRIATIGWTVPRAASFEDLARNAEIAAYRTPAGNGITGLAVDLERGEEFMGGPRGKDDLRTYLATLRRAVGPRVLLIATIEDPYLEHLDQTKFPYREIARDADVLQPMTYWRMMGPWDTIPKVQTAVAGSVALVRRLAARDVPIDVGAQTAVLSKRGAPPGDELTAAIEASRRAGAIGVTFYDWNGTGPEQWDAIARAAW